MTTLFEPASPQQRVAEPSSSAQSIRVSRDGPVVVVHVRGALDPTSLLRLRHIVVDLIEDQGNGSVVVQTDDADATAALEMVTELLASERVAYRPGVGSA